MPLSDIDYDLYSIEVRNSGNARAQNVKIKLTQSEELEVRNWVVDTIPSSIPYQEIESENAIDLNVANFFPDDQIKISIVVSRGRIEPPFVSVRSDGSNGIRKVKAPAGTDERDVRRDLLSLALTLIFAQFFISFILMRFSNWRAKKNYKKRMENAFHPSRNNLGFLLLHSGSYDLAKQLFEKAIMEGDTYPLTFSNLMLAKYFLNEVDDIERLIHSSRWPSGADHDRAVLAFNEALYFLNEGDEDKGMELLEEALSLSAEIKKYCEFSAIVGDLIGKVPKIQISIDRSSAVVAKKPTWREWLTPA